MRFLILIFLTALLSSCCPIEQETVDNKSSTKTFIQQPIVFDVIRIRSGPRIETFWNGEMPEFVFCKSSGISRTRASQGISYWKRLGYPITRVRYDVEGEECYNNPRYGTVLIRLIDNTIPIHQELGVTKVYYQTDTKAIQGATIYLIGGYANRPRLIEHEIGHSLGWRHHNRYLHIMNSEYDETGNDSSGVRYRSYIELISNYF